MILFEMEKFLFVKLSLNDISLAFMAVDCGGR
jgi:hypothetical protein